MFREGNGPKEWERLWGGVSRRGVRGEWGGGKEMVQADIKKKQEGKQKGGNSGNCWCGKRPVSLTGEKRHYG